MICTTPYDDNRNRRFLCGGERHECEDGTRLCEVCDADEIEDDELEKCPGCGLLVAMQAIRTVPAYLMEQLEATGIPDPDEIRAAATTIGRAEKCSQSGRRRPAPRRRRCVMSDEKLSPMQEAVGRNESDGRTYVTDSFALSRMDETARAVMAEAVQRFNSNQYSRAAFLAYDAAEALEIERQRRIEGEGGAS